MLGLQCLPSDVSPINCMPSKERQLMDSIPGTVSTASTASEHSDDSHQHSLMPSRTADVVYHLGPVGRSGEISPSIVCSQRKLSAAIVTAGDTYAANHEYVAGRPTIPVVPIPLSIPSQQQKVPKKKLGSKISHLVPKPSKSKNHHHRRTSKEDASASDFTVEQGQQAQQTATATGDLLLNEPSPLRLEAWEEPNASAFSVRGATYMKDRKKVTAQPSFFSLLTVDLVQSKEPIMGGLCNHPNERIQMALRREKQTGVKQLPNFIFAVNLAVPGTPYYHMVIYMGTDDIDALKDTNTPMGRLTSKFFFGESDKYRDETFKLIPRIVDGNFVVKKAVGSKPSIIGRKLKNRYIRDQKNHRFFELIVDIGSDSVAQKIVQLSTGYAASIIVEMLFLLEGVDEQTLPERILGGIRLNRIDFKKRDGQRICSHNV